MNYQDVARELGMSFSHMGAFAAHFENLSRYAACDEPTMDLNPKLARINAASGANVRVPKAAQVYGVTFLELSLPVGPDHYETMKMAVTIDNVYMAIKRPGEDSRTISPEIHAQTFLRLWKKYYVRGDRFPFKVLVTIHPDWTVSTNVD